MTPDVWDDAERLERYVGRWSRLVAREFVDWLEVQPDSRWLDVGCGSGALTETLLAQAAPVAVVGIDTSEAYVAYAAPTALSAIRSTWASSRRRSAS